MSSGRRAADASAAFRTALAIVDRYRLPTESQRCVRAVLEGCRPGTLEFTCEAGADANLPLRDLLSRSAAIYFAACCVNLADDLIDGDCTYLPEPGRNGPCTQFILHNLFVKTLGESRLPAATVAGALSDLIRAAGAEHVEVRTQRWTAGKFKSVANGISGRLFSAYVRILWARTSLARRAGRVGTNLGIAVLVSEDIRSRDRRYTSLSRLDRRLVVEWAMRASAALRREKIRSVDRVLSGLEPALRRAW